MLYITIDSGGFPVNDRVKKEIEEIIGKMKCQNDFSCYKSGFRELCKARDFGIEGYLECLEDNPLECKFAIAYGTLYFCKCPLRYYLEKNSKVDE
jgi:hypothetical protein